MIQMMKTYTVHKMQFPIGKNCFCAEAVESRDEITGWREARRTAAAFVAAAPLGEYRDATIIRGGKYGARAVWFSKRPASETESTE